MKIDGFLFVFIRDNYELSPERIAIQLNLLEINPFIQEDNMLEDIQFVRKNDWVYLIDHGWHLYVHTDKLYSNLKKIGESYELLYCTAGDIDESYEFIYYKNNSLVRDFALEYKNLTSESGIITRDFGIPFTIEKNMKEIIEPFEKIESVIKHLNINTNFPSNTYIPFNYQNKIYHYKER